MKMRLVKRECLDEVCFDTGLAKQKEIIFNLFSKLGRQMMIMVPVLALIALNHECFNQFRIMRFLAVAIRVEVILIVHILLILII
jgi:hypothetical protein